MLVDPDVIEERVNNLRFDNEDTLFDSEEGREADFLYFLAANGRIGKELIDIKSVKRVRLVEIKSGLAGIGMVVATAMAMVMAMGA